MEGGERKSRCGASVSPRTRARRGEESARGATGVALPDGRRVARPSSQQGWRPPARGKKGGVESGRDAWMPRRPGGGLRAAQCDGRAALSVGGEKQRNREGSLRWQKSGPICNFQKLEGPDCKAEITFKIGLK